MKNNIGKFARHLALAIGLFGSCRVAGAVWNDGAGHDWTYEIDGDEVTITAVTETGTTTSVSGEIEIPETIDGRMVIGFGSSFKANKKITCVKIPSGVTALTSGAFSQCEALLAAEIPETVQTIGGGVFSGCSSLETCRLPSSLTEIPSSMFSGCHKLKVVNIPSGVVTIRGSAFDFCKALTSLSLPAGLKTIESTAFNGSGIAEVSFPESLVTIGSFAFCASALTSISIPDGVTTIGPSAFQQCTKLESVSIGRSAVLNDNVFIGCSALRTISVSENHLLYSSYDGVLYGKDFSSIKVFPADRTGSVELHGGLTHIAAGAFANCAFSGIALPESVVSIGDSAFKACGNLGQITIPANVVALGEGAFEGCTRLEAINVAAGNATYATNDGIVYDKQMHTLIVCPSGRSADVSVPEGVSRIGDNAFARCSKIKKVNLPGTMEALGDGAFQYCSLLERVELGANLTTIGVGAFRSCQKISEISIPETVTRIGTLAFVGCSSLVRIALPQGLESLQPDTFCNCTSIETIEIPPNITTIPGDCFMGCSKLRSVKIPNGVTTIGGYAFYRCSNLADIKIPGSVTTVSASSFKGCTALRSLTLPEGVAQIGNYAFQNCSSLSRIDMPSSVTDIGNGAFNGCTTLAEVVFQCDAPTMGDAVFVDSGARGYVTRESTGWGVEIPGRWNAITLDYIDNYYKIVFDANGGEIDELDSTAYIVKGGAITSMPTLARENCKFLGWFTAAVGGELVSPGTVVTSDMMLYAHWRAYDDPLPPVSEDSGVMAVMGDSADFRLAENVKTIDDYDALVEWADINGIGHQAVRTSPHVWASYVLGAETLLENEPTVEFETLEIEATEGGLMGAASHAIMVSVSVKDGEKSVAVDSEKVATMFEATSDLGNWSGAALAPQVQSLGKSGNAMRFTVKPGDGSSPRAFLRIRK